MINGMTAAEFDREFGRLPYTIAFILCMGGAVIAFFGVSTILVEAPMRAFSTGLVIVLTGAAIMGATLRVPSQTARGTLALMLLTVAFGCVAIDAFLVFNQWMQMHFHWLPANSNGGLMAQVAWWRMAAVALIAAAFTIAGAELWFRLDRMPAR